MSDKARMAAMEAVAEAARNWCDWEREQPSDDDPRYGLWAKVDNALIALAALPATPAPEARTVTLAVWEDKEDGDINLMRPGDTRDRQHQSYYQWRRLGTVTLPLDPEPQP